MNEQHIDCVFNDVFIDLILVAHSICMGIFYKM